MRAAWPVAAIGGFVLLLLAGGCGGGGGHGPADLANNPGDSGGNSATATGLVVRTAASADYRSVTLGAAIAGDLSFTGLYRAWFTYVGYQPPMGWLTGQNRSVSSELIVSREDGTGAHIVAETNFRDNSGGSTFMDVEFPRWSPDGREIALAPAGKGIYICTVSNGKLLPLARFGAVYAVKGIAWASNGTLYASVNPGTGQYDIYRYYLGSPGSMPSRVTNSTDQEGEIDVSPDNGWLVWSTRPSSTADYDIVMMPRGGDPDSDTVVLADSSANETCPRWSPAGRLVAFIKGKNLYVIDTVTFRERQLTDLSSGSVEGCDWSSDGQYVLYTVYRDLYKIRCDGALGDEIVVRSDWGQFVDNWSPGLARARVLIGPSGSDWEGADPPFGRQRAGLILVTGLEGLVSSVSFQVPSSSTLLIADRTPEGSRELVVAEAKAIQVQRVLEENGPGNPKTVWDFTSLSPAPGSVLVVFDLASGKVRSVTASHDQVGSSAAHGPRVSMEDGSLVIRGSALRAYDARGRLVSGPRPLSRVSLNASTGQFIPLGAQ